MRSSCLVDANLLVLLIVGNVRRSLVDRHPELKAYSVSDYDLLVSQFGPGCMIYVTPNTLTETSNLLRLGPESINASLFDELRSMIQDNEEVVVVSKRAASRSEFGWLGLTDTVLLELATPETPLITTDLRLWSTVIGFKPDAAVNFHHLRRRKFVD